MPEPSVPAYVRPAIVAALVSGLFGIFAAALISLLLWLGPRNGSPTDALVLGLSVWVVIHGSGLSASGVDIGLVPLGGSLVVGITLYYVARKVAVDPIVNWLAFAGVSALTYAAFVVLAASLNPYDGATFGQVRVGVGAFVLAFVACGAGAAAEHGSGAAWWATVDGRVRGVLRGAGATLLALLAVALVIVLGLLFAHRDTAKELWTSLDPGFSGGVAVALLCLAVLPNLMLWSLAVLLGPGFALGTNTAVTLGSAQLGAIPGLPILAALPSGGSFSGWTFALAALPIAAAVLGGFWSTRPDEVVSLVMKLLVGAGSGAVAGVVLGLLLSVSGGSVGPGRMTETGPPTLVSFLLSVVILSAGGALGGLLGHYRVARATADE
ncbi:hypothetical protein BH09ACT10_BH09ACT10_24470 [soil metagenome]